MHTSVSSDECRSAGRAVCRLGRHGVAARIRAAAPRAALRATVRHGQKFACRRSAPPRLVAAGAECARGVAARPARRVRSRCDARCAGCAQRASRADPDAGDAQQRAQGQKRQRPTCCRASCHCCCSCLCGSCSSCSFLFFVFFLFTLVVLVLSCCSCSSTNVLGRFRPMFSDVCIEIGLNSVWANSADVCAIAAKSSQCACQKSASFCLAPVSCRALNVQQPKFAPGSRL